MKAIVYNVYGGTDRLMLTDWSTPDLQADEARVRIKSISLNPRDVAIRSGEFKFLSGRSFPKLTGCDFAGEITELNAQEATALKVGDAVFGYYESIRGGISATQAVVPIKYLARKPAGTSYEVASTLGCAYLTAWQALTERVNVKPSERVLLYGASGGVGTAALQIGKHLGAHLTAVSHSSNRQYCIEQGADEFIAYDQEDVFQRKASYDVFFQVFSKAGSVYDQAKALLPKQGRFICLIPNPLYTFKKLFARPSFDFMLVKNRVADLQTLGQLTEQKVLRPFIDQTFPMADYRSAFEHLEQGKLKGKVVIQIAE